MEVIISMGEVYSWVKNIIIFLVLTTIVTNLLGKSNYKKYIKLITGIILVILVISPLLKLFHLDDTLDFYFSENVLFAETEDINGKLIDMEQGQMSTIFKEYKEKIAAQVGNLLEVQDLYIVSITITVDEDETSKELGNLKAMDITASYVRQNTNTSSSEIDKIDIEKIEISDKNKSEAVPKKEYLSPSEINVKNLLSDFYNMNSDNINISIQEQ